MTVVSFAVVVTVESSPGTQMLIAKTVHICPIPYGVWSLKKVRCFLSFVLLKINV